MPVLYLWLRAGSAVRVLHDGNIYVWRLLQHVQRVFVGGARTASGFLEKMRSTTANGPEI